MNKLLYKTIKFKFCSKLYVGINNSSKMNIKVGVVNEEGKVISREKVDIKALNFSDEEYLTLKRKATIKEICNNLKNVKIISLDQNMSESEFEVINTYAMENQIEVLSTNYEYDLCNFPYFKNTINVFPCLNLLINRKKIGIYYVEDSNKIYQIGEANADLSIISDVVKNFILNYARNKKEDQVLDKFMKEELTNIKNFSLANFLIKFYTNFENVNSVNQNKEKIFFEKYNLSFNNYDDIIYISRLKALFESNLYVKPKSTNKIIFDYADSNYIIENIKLLAEGLVTLINFKIFSNLCLMEHNQIQIKTIVIKKK